MEGERPAWLRDSIRGQGLHYAKCEHFKAVKKGRAGESCWTVVTNLISGFNAKARLQFAKFHYDLFGDFHLLSTPNERIEFCRKMEQFCYVDETYIVYCAGLGRYLRVKQTRGGGDDDCEVLGEEDQQLDGAQRKLVRDAFKSTQDFAHYVGDVPALVQPSHLRRGRTALLPSPKRSDLRPSRGNWKRKAQWINDLGGNYGEYRQLSPHE